MLLFAVSSFMTAVLVVISQQTASGLDVSESSHSLCPNFYHLQEFLDGQRVYRVLHAGMLAMKTTVGDNGANIVQQTDGRRLVNAVYGGLQSDRLLWCDVTEQTTEIAHFIQHFYGQINSTAERWQGEFGDGMCGAVDQILDRFAGRALESTDGNVRLLTKKMSNLLKHCERLQREFHRAKQYRDESNSENTNYMSSKNDLEASQADKLNSDKEGRARGGRQRRSLSLILPGTRWCGVGNESSHERDFGNIASTDLCCYEHDHCDYTIEGFTSKYNLFNYRFHTLSHCECDDRFRSCLRATASDEAQLLGKLYFNVIGMKCFVFRPERVCAERTWWGKCIRHKTRISAEMHGPLTY